MDRLVFRRYVLENIFWQFCRANVKRIVEILVKLVGKVGLRLPPVVAREVGGRRSVGGMEEAWAGVEAGGGRLQSVHGVVEVVGRVELVVLDSLLRAVLVGGGLRVGVGGREVVVGGGVVAGEGAGGTLEQTARMFC